MIPFFHQSPVWSDLCRGASRPVLVLAWLLASPGPAASEAVTNAEWRGVHLMAPNGARLALVERAIAGPLAALGINTILLEINYGFAWQSHPELASPGNIDKTQARHLASVCREKGIRLIPLFNCLGHQSWAKQTLPLLAKHPEFDETPQIPKDNPDIYCRSWCPQHPDVNRVVFALMDELLDAFQADALHVGMDEIFLIGHAQCPRCRGQDTAQLFAKAVNDYHRHLVGEKKVEMLLWGDRLLDDRAMRYGEWESSRNGTAPAIDLIAKDIVICDWHYEPRDSYPSVPYLQQKGFRCWPSSWRNREAALALRNYAQRTRTPRLLGHLVTTWVGGDSLARVLLGEGGDDPALKQAREVADALRACFEKPVPKE
jgi:hypothetical protein